MTIICLLLSLSAFAQVDKKDVRRGNRQFAKAKYGDADISYRKGLNADSTSVAAAYDLGNNLYRQGNYAEAGKFYQQALRHVPETRSLKKQNAQGFDTFFNLGDAALQQKQYRAAMEAFVQALIIDPDNLEAKENYVYARKMLKTIRTAAGMTIRTRIRTSRTRTRTKTRIKTRTRTSSRIRIRTRTRTSRTGQG